MPVTIPEHHRSTRTGTLLFFSALFLFFAMPRYAHSQDFEEWMRSQQQQYQDFRAEQNQAFANMLREHWQAMQGQQPDKQLEEDKPAEIPVAEPAPVPSEPERPVPEPPAEPVRTLPVRPPAPEPPPPPPPAPEPSLPTVSVPFYGLSFRVPYDPDISRISIPASFNAETIAKIWEEMSATNIEPSVSFYSKFQESTDINDWGIARLMFGTGQALFNNSDMARLYTWFMLIQNGYQARVGYNDEGVRLMIAADSHIFGTPFFRFEEVPFFLAFFDKIPPGPERLYTYSSNFPGDLQPLSLQVSSVARLKRDYSSKDLSFNYKGETISVTVNIDKNLIALYRYYPQTDLSVYFNAPVTPSTASEILDALRPHVENRPEREAVDLLLRFVQTAFGYKIDPDNFGREKPLFPEETLYYDYSDCEDRAILFSFLVRELLDMDVVGLRYPGHIATAVRFRSSFQGDTVQVNGTTYHVCDPTYINAGPGMAMTRFQNTTPEVIPVHR